MQTTLSANTVSRNSHQIRLAALFIAIVITSAALVTVGAQAYAGSAVSQAKVASIDAARAAANSTRLLKLDQQFAFAASPAQGNSRLAAINAEFYPAEPSAAQIAQSKRLQNLNAEFYPAEANPVTIAAQHSARVLKLNEEFYPAEPSAASIAGQHAVRLLNLNNEFYPNPGSATGTGF